jgi:glutamate/tyrosine decarboxylase-like PLP-dependent enzyme
VMQAVGSKGYLESCRNIVLATRRIADIISSSEIPELYVLGDPPASVVAFGSQHPDVNVLEVGDAMSRKGWHLNSLSGPAAVHIAVTVRLLYLSVDCFLMSWQCRSASHPPTCRPIYRRSQGCDPGSQGGAHWQGDDGRCLRSRELECSWTGYGW